jgi:hypothetical protein
MRAVMHQLIAADGCFSGMDALCDDRGRWAVSLHDPALQRTVQLSDYALFERHFPLFLSRPRPQMLHYWAAPHASLRWVEVLGILRHVEQLYPRWQVQALFENQRNRYEVAVLERQQTAGVHLVRTVAEFQRAVE